MVQLHARRELNGEVFMVVEMRLSKAMSAWRLWLRLLVTSHFSASMKVQLSDFQSFDTLRTFDL